MRIGIREVVLAYAVLSDVRMFIRSSIVVMSKLRAVADSNYSVSPWSVHSSRCSMLCSIRYTPCVDLLCMCICSCSVGVVLCTCVIIPHPYKRVCSLEALNPDMSKVAKKILLLFSIGQVNTVN